MQSLTKIKFDELVDQEISEMKQEIRFMKEQLEQLLIWKLHQDTEKEKDITTAHYLWDILKINHALQKFRCKKCGGPMDVEMGFNKHTGKATLRVVCLDHPSEFKILNPKPYLIERK